MVFSRAFVYTGSMKITYIDHSGFVLEAVNCTIIIDYVKGKLPDLRTDKPIYVLASHRHEDHFSPKIFKISDQYDDVYYFLSSDIEGGGRVPDAKRKLVTFVHPGQHFSLARFWLNVYGSTDLGVSFGIKVSTYQVFHAGDLNDWCWPPENPEDAKDNRKMEREYRRILSGLDDAYDVAFLPVDPRLGAQYVKGVKEFLEGRTVGQVVPMHFWGEYGVCEKLEQDLGRPVVRLKRKGQWWEVA